VNSSFALREAQPGDEHALYGMVHELADYEKLTHLVSGTADDLARELFGERPVIEALIATSDGEPAGFALYFHNYSTFLARRGLYLEDVYVKPVFRRRGIGRALLVKLAQIALARGCGRFEWSVLDWNEPAIHFYEGLGATVMPEWRIARVTGNALKALASKPKAA
jgi:GNAT superfamily N-acetyltransferase